jgi:hypothetical protein
MPWVGSLRRIALVLVSIAPVAARAEVRLLEADLRAPDLDLRTFALVTVQQDAPPKTQEEPKTQGEPEAQGSTDDGANGALDFDLLGEAKPPPVPPEDRSMRHRRRLLGLHQTAGIGLFALQVATTVAGQLNYNDRFGDANTARYKTPHAVFAYTTLGVFAATGALALLAPDPASKPDRGFDRVSLHKLSMFTAAAGMAAQVALGIYTAHRDGYENKQDFGRIHLVVGYATLAAVTAGVSAIVF